MNNIWIIRYGHNYEHDRILGAFSSKKIANKELEDFLKNSEVVYGYCYIEKLEIDKTYKGN